MYTSHTFQPATGEEGGLCLLAHQGCNAGILVKSVGDPPIYGCQQKWDNSFSFEDNLGKISGRIELVASIELLKIILQVIKISPSFNLDDGFDLDDGFETVNCRTLF